MAATRAKLPGPPRGLCYNSASTTDPERSSKVVKTKHLAVLVAVILVLPFVAPHAHPQGLSSARVVTAAGYLSIDRVHPGSAFHAAVVADVAEGWHVNAHNPSLDYLIATAFTVDPNAPAGFSFQEPIYPPHVTKAFSFTKGATLRVYEGKIPIGIAATAARDLVPGEARIEGTLTVQACNDTSCLAPARIRIAIPVTIAAPGEPVNAINQEIFTAIAFEGGAFPDQDESAAAPASGAAGTAAVNSVERWIVDHGWLATLALIFLGGLALNLTPCVYPLIPITLAYFGGQASGRPSRTFGLASAYVLGMCATYSALGVLAATTGGLLGAILQNPVALVFVALVLVALGLSMFGLYDVQVPMALRSRITSRSGFGGAIFMGLTVGLVAAPCIGPFVVALLAYVGRVGSPLLGFWLFFVLALGLGLPYLFLGGFAGAATGLPRAGAWMVWVKKLFGCVMFAMAFYFVNPLLPAAFATYSIPIVLIASGVYLGFVEGSPIRSAGFRVARVATAAVCAVIAALLMIPANASQGIAWEPYSAAAFQEAVAAGRPVLIDVTAEWCLPCKEMDHFTFTDPAVVAEAGRFTTLRADITRGIADDVVDLQASHKILGAPTFLFIGPDGREREELRLTGFEKAPAFLARMEAVR